MSTDDDAGFDAARAAVDPRTDWETLHRIAEDHPELRAEVAANPNTYAELLEALASLGDPEIDAALASREGADAAAWTGWQAEPGPPAMESETGQFQALMDDAGEEVTDEPMTPEDSGGPAAVPPPSRPAVERFELPAREPEPIQEEPGQDDAALAAALPAAAGTGAAGAGGGSAGGMLPPEGSGGSGSGRRAGMLALAIGLLVLAVVAIGALIMMLFGDDEPPAAEGPLEDQGQQEPGAPEDGAETGEQAQEAALAEARSAVQQLPESTTCGDPSEEAQTLADYAALAAENEAWNDQDRELLEFTFEDLQDACDTTHAAGVFHALRADTESPEALTASLDEVGVDWADVAFEASGAQTMDSFVTPDGNIHCEWDEGVRCTVMDFDYDPPSGCEDATTYSLTVDDAGTACDDPVTEDDDRETLDHDQTAAIGVLACVSLDDRVSCYSMVDGSGFEVSEGGHYTTDPAA